jgi:acyl-coenzyme A thioesterase 13
MPNVLAEPPPPDAEILSHVRSIHENRLLPLSPIYSFLLTPIQFVSATSGVVVARLPISRTHTNSKGGIHGSVSACIVDWVGGLAIASADMRDSTGVSTDIHISYVGLAKEGDTIEIEGRARKVGGSLAFTDATIWKLVDGQRGPIIATGSHTKYVRSPGS